MCCVNFVTELSEIVTLHVTFFALSPCFIYYPFCPKRTRKPRYVSFPFSSAKPARRLSRKAPSFVRPTDNGGPENGDETAVGGPRRGGLGPDSFGERKHFPSLLSLPESLAGFQSETVNSPRSRERHRRERRTSSRNRLQQIPAVGGSDDRRPVLLPRLWRSLARSLRDS